MWTRAELKENAKKFFKFNYWKMVLVAFILSMIGGGSGGGGASFNYQQRQSYNLDGMSPLQQHQFVQFITAFMVIFIVIMIVVCVLDIFVFAALRVGAYRFFVVSHYQKADLNELGFAFTHSYLNIIKTMFLRGLYTTLWTLLFIVPGIIKAYEYRMIPYIMAEHPEIDTKEAFAISKQMMTGNKWDAFVLDLSFLGWEILSVFTCGILSIFYVNPYVCMTNAELYVKLKEITYGGNGQYRSYDNTYSQNQGGQWNGHQTWNQSQGSQWNGQQNWDQSQGGQWNGQQTWNQNQNGQQNWSQSQDSQWNDQQNWDQSQNRNGQ